ncbi:MAG: hypothetical protein ACK4MQ_12575 [Hyphomonas sp.]
MQINVRKGTLSLGSVYKLIFAGWIISWGVFMGTILCLILLIAMLTGSTTFNDEVVEGRGAVLVTLVPLFVLFPIVIFFHALMFSGFLTFGVWLYRKFRPITVVNHDTPAAF